MVASGRDKNLAVVKQSFSVIQLFLLEILNDIRIVKHLDDQKDVAQAVTAV